MKKVLIVLLASSMFFNTACTDEDAALGAAAVGAALDIGVAVAVGNAERRDRHDHHDDHRDDCDHGYDHDHHRGDWDRGRDRRNYSLNIALPEGVSIFSQAPVSPEIKNFSIKYNVPTEAAQKIQKAFLNAKAQGLSSFATIGLSKDDIKGIIKREMPESDSLQSVASKLDISQAQARDLIKYMITEFDIQAANVTSQYWQACIAKGTWKTQKSSSCTSVSSRGCGPSTGATLCF
ncbi:MAG: hypothetical protein J7501_13930 [Bdellovibrio sp.]|nr:hypothetical protein [Bdellovibrio sp.]